METTGMIVVDESHTAAAKALQEMCQLLDEGIASYLTILEQVTTEAAKAGHTTTRYQEYASIISGLKGQFSKMGTTLNMAATRFVADIDAADSYLY